MRTVERLDAGDAAAWYVFADRRTELHPDLAALLARHGADRPDIGIFYGDEVVSSGPATPFSYLCKPDFDRTQLIARDYVGLPVAVRSGAMSKLAPPADAAGVYALLLEAIQAGIEVGRITEVLGVNPPDRQRASRQERSDAVARFLAEAWSDCQIVPGLLDDSLELRARFDDPPHVTLVVPTNQSTARDGGAAGASPMITGLLESLVETDWPMDRLHVLVGDDREDGSAYQRRSWPFSIERVVTARLPSEPFNYAVKVNALWRQARTEQLVLMNDDLLVRSRGWLRAMLTFSMDESVGGVGARLLYPDDRIQHVGMPGGVLGTCTHAFIGMPATERSYQDWAVVQREWSVVTGAVFATRRSVLERLNGFDERYRLDYNDVDLCLRMRLLGLKIVYTPHAELTHLESASRRTLFPPPADTAVFLESWREFLRNDPAYHPRLTRTTPMIEPVVADTDWWRHFRGA